MPAVLEFGTQYWGATNNFVLAAVPLFVLLGELLVRGGFTDRMYQSLSDWLNHLARRPAAYQPWRIRHVRRSFGLVGGHGRHHRHGRHPGLQGPELRPAVGAGHHRRRRHAGHPDSAVDQHDHLRRHDEYLCRAPLRGRRHSGPVADCALHGCCRRSPAGGSHRWPAPWPHLRSAGPSACAALCTCCHRRRFSWLSWAAFIWAGPLPPSQLHWAW